MLDAAACRKSLPEGWPDRIRSSTVQAISLAHFSLTFARGVAASSINKRMRLQPDVDRLQQEAALLREELRIKVVRVLRIPAQGRPHYPPTERLAILELRAARAWSTAEPARRLLVTPLTVTSWMSRLEDEGPDALVRLPEPVNRFPESVGYIVRRLKTLCPTMGTRKIAQHLCRAGLHLGATTVRTMQQHRPPRPSFPASNEARRRVTARRPNDVLHVDLNTVPISMGFRVARLPFALPPCQPFCWWIAVVVDHDSRRAMGVAVFTRPPWPAAVRSFLERAFRETGAPPKYLIRDHGTQFVAKAFARWCRREDIRQRFAAIGEFGSFAVVERLIWTITTECTRRILVPRPLAQFQREPSFFPRWYNGERPHGFLMRKRRTLRSSGDGQPVALHGSSHMRVGHGGAVCGTAGARPWSPRRRGRDQPTHRAGRKHLPVVGLRRAA